MSPLHTSPIPAAGVCSGLAESLDNVLLGVLIDILLQNLSLDSNTLQHFSSFNGLSQSFLNCHTHRERAVPFTAGALVHPTEGRWWEDSSALPPPSPPGLLRAAKESAARRTRKPQGPSRGLGEFGRLRS